MQHDQHVIDYHVNLLEMQKLWRLLQATALSKPTRLMAFLPNELNDMLA